MELVHREFWVVFEIILIFIFTCSKGDYDAAITQYISTIGKLEPSYVIRKVQELELRCGPCEL